MANGLFNLKQVMQAVQQGGWPAQKTPAVEYLVVAGGGSGGSVYGGGGGAGGLLQGIDPVPNGQTLLVTVGAGGTGSGSSGNVGGASVFGNISAAGGGGGSTSAGNGATSGGSGGGGGQSVFFTTQGVAGQGNGGGQSSGGGNGYGGGGGGAGTAGYRYGGSGGGGSTGGNGGTGIASAISGTVTSYAGGGGGGTLDPVSSAGLGGVGGGGNGGGNNLAATAGTANTGGGGGGAYNATSPAGGSGIVIVSYPDVYAAATATTGSPTVSTSGSGSLAFTGAVGNYLYYGGQSPFIFGTGDFTIEFWIYFNNFTSSPIIADWRAGGSNGAFPTFYISGANSMIYYVNGTDAITSSTLSTSTWYHFAVCRTGTVTKMYLNGTQTGSSYTDTTNYTANATAPYIGSGSTSLNGNLTNFRVVKGVCVYTGTFTPSTSPLAATQPAGTNIAAITGTQTSLLLNSASGARLADSSTNSYVASVTGTVMAWSQLSPFATGSGYKNRVYTWTTSGTITF